MPDYIEPFGFILFRVGLSCMVFWCLHHWLVAGKLLRRDFPLLVLCAVLGVAANQLLFFKGLNWSTPINASLIMTTTPVLVLVAASFLLHEKITARKILGISLGALGAFYLIVSSQANQWGALGMGELLVFLTACSYGFYIVLVKKLLIKYHPLTVVKWLYAFGLLMVLPFGFKQALAVQWSTFPTGIWVAFLFVVLGATVLAFMFNAYAIKELSPTTVSIYIYSQPLMATMIALYFEKDLLTVPKLISGLLIGLGVFLVSHAGKRSQSAYRAANPEV